MKFLKEVLKGLAAIVGLLFGWLLTKEIAKIGNVKRIKNWAVVNKKTIALLDDKGNVKEKIRLPKDPETNKQIESQEIEAVGISEEGEVNVKIKHDITNRFFNRKPPGE